MVAIRYFNSVDIKDDMNYDKLRLRLPAVGAAVIIVLGVLGLVRKCGGTDQGLSADYERPGGDTLAVAIEMSPLTYSFSNDTAEGFDYEILRDIAREHDIALSLHPFSNLDKAFKELYDGDYDLLVASIPTTNALKEYFPLTDAVYLDKQVLVQRADSAGGRGPISSQEQLMGDTVWVSEGSPYLTRLRNMSHELGDSIYVATLPEYSSEHLAILTALGEVKHAVVSEAIAKKIAADYPQLDIGTPISFNQFQCWAVAPGDSALLDSLNSWLKQFRATPAYKALADKYLEDRTKLKAEE